MTNYTAPLRFRAWDKKRKVMFHAYQLTFALRGGVAIAPVQSGKVDAVLMQSTGLPDKNGKEIFGGDIVLWNTSIPAQPYGDSPDPGEPRFSMCEVTYHCGRFGCDVKDGGFGDISLHQAFDEFGEPEVIGNVFENPELREGVSWS